MRVSVVYATPETNWEKSLDLDPPATVRAAIEQSGVLSVFPALGLDALSVGVFGKRCALDARVEEGDRIEIYRPLQVDPKEARRVRAEVRRRAGPRPRH